MHGTPFCGWTIINFKVSLLVWTFRFFSDFFIMINEGGITSCGHLWLYIRINFQRWDSCRKVRIVNLSSRSTLNSSTHDCGCWFIFPDRSSYCSRECSKNVVSGAIIRWGHAPISIEIGKPLSRSCSWVVQVCIISDWAKVRAKLSWLPIWYSFDVILYTLLNQLWLVLSLGL